MTSNEIVKWAWDVGGRIAHKMDVKQDCDDLMAAQYYCALVLIFPIIRLDCDYAEMTHVHLATLTLGIQDTPTAEMPTYEELRDVDNHPLIKKLKSRAARVPFQ